MNLRKSVTRIIVLFVIAAFIVIASRFFVLPNAQAQDSQTNNSFSEAFQTDAVTQAIRDQSTRLARVSVKSQSDRTKTEKLGMITADYGSFVTVAVTPQADLENLPLEIVPLETKIYLPGRSFDPLQTANAETVISDVMNPAEKGYYLLQFGGITKDEWLEGLRSVGVEILQYVPHQAFFVYGNADAIQRAASHSRVCWVGKFTAADKISEDLQARIDAVRNKKEGDKNNYLEFSKQNKAKFDIAIFSRADLKTVKAAIAGVPSVEVRQTSKLPNNFFNVVRVEMSLNAIEQIAQIPDVVRIDPYFSPQTEDEKSNQILAGNYTSSTSINPPGYDPLALFGVDGSNVTVSVVDSGIGIPGNGGFYVTSNNTVNAPLRGATDPNGSHGHMVATIIAGAPPFAGLDPQGYNYGLGVAPKANLINVPYLADDYSGTEADLYNDSVTTIAPNGLPATITNNSWGRENESGLTYTSYEAQFDGFARDASFAASIDPLLIVFAAGNTGPGALSRPKATKNSVVVGNSENIRPDLDSTADNIDDLRNTSSRGPTADGRIKPDVTAPGTAITGGNSPKKMFDIPGDPFHQWSTGTSFASPHAAGAAALFTDFWKRNHGGQNPSPALIKAALITGAEDMNGFLVTDPRPNGREGWGRLNLKGVLNTGVSTEYVNQTVEFTSPGDSTTINGFIADSSKAVRFALVWTDPPGIGDPALVNNLDLTVTIGGITYNGNVFSGGFSTTGGTANTVDNVENVFLPAGIPAGTAVSIQVSATALNGDGILGNADLTDQHFALVSYNFSPTAIPVITERKWDGSGTTSNWSEAANWSGDVLPSASEKVVFDGTSSKNVVIDANLTVGGWEISSGYTGTISQGASTITVNGAFSQADGTFTGGSGSINFNSGFTLSGGTFTASTGAVSFAGNALISGGTFNPNGGTIVLDGSLASFDIPSTITFNNLTINKTDGESLAVFGGDTIIVTGTLTLNDGRLGSGGTIQAEGDVIFGGNFDGGTAKLVIAGSAARTITLPSGVNLPDFTVNAPNVILNAGGTVVFSQPVYLQNALSFTNDVGDFIFNAPFTQTGGVFNVGSGTVDFNSVFRLSGGTFNPFSNTIVFSSSFIFSGGALDATSANFIFDGANANAELSSNLTLNNLTVNKNSSAALTLASSGILQINGTLTLANGKLGGSGKVQAGNSLVIDSGFAGGKGTVSIGGSNSRTITFPAGAIVPVLEIDAPNAVINASGSGTVSFDSVTLKKVGGFTNGATDFSINGFFQQGGAFSGGSGTITINNLLQLGGGTFQASSGTTYLNLDLIQNGGTFQHNNGMVIFRELFGFVDVIDTITFNHLTINKSSGTPLTLNNGVTFRAIGNTVLTDGGLDGDGTLQVEGNLAVGAAFGNGGFGPGTANITLTGAASQTFTSGGGALPTGTWTLNKSGGTFNLNSDLNLNNDFFNSLVLSNGTITTGTHTVNAGVRNITRTSGYIKGNLQRQFNATGAKNFDVGTENGYSPVNVNVTALTTNPSDLKIGAVQATHPNAPNAPSALKRFWSLTETGSLTAILTFKYLDTDMPVGISESSFELKRYTGNGTTFDTVPATLDTTANTVTTTSGISDFSDWTLISQLSPTAASVTVGGRIITPTGRGIFRARVHLTDQFGNVKTAITNPFGYYRFADVTVGSNYVFSVGHKWHQFAAPTQVHFIDGDRNDISFIASP